MQAPATTAQPVPPSVGDVVLEAISDGFFTLDREWRFTSFNAAAETFFRLPRSEVLGRTIWAVSPRTLGSEFERRYRLVMDRGEPQAFEIDSALRPDQVHEIRALPLPDGIGVVFRDITERKRTEERQRLLVNELNHRVKNTLAIVQAIAAQSFRSANSAGEAYDALEGRLFALARVHDVLTRESWEGADLRQVVSQALTPYGVENSRVAVTGPSVRLISQSAIAVSMALQELVTNAIKYGALSTASGAVHITWSTAERPDGTHLHFLWEERGGPTVSPPTRQGFGVRLIKRSLALDLGGFFQLDFLPAGLICSIEARLPSA